jgi:predicted nucleic acid-binding protein
MILTDTGPLIALINKNDPNHQKCIQATTHLPAVKLVTTWPCFTEAMYLLFRAGRHPAQAQLWRWRAAERLVLHNATEDELDRMSILMERYNDRPMDLADASLVAAAEKIQMRRIFTLDSDFHVYRLVDGSAMECIP